MEEISREYYLAHSRPQADGGAAADLREARGDLGRERSRSRSKRFATAAKGAKSGDRRGCCSIGKRSRRARASSRRSTSDRSRGKDPRSVKVGGRRSRFRTRRPRSRSRTTPTRSSATRSTTARAKLVERELAPLRRERFQRERDIIESLGIAANYNATFELLSGISLGELKAQCEQFLRDTQAMWDEMFPAFTKRVLGMQAGGGDARGRARAVSRARLRRVFSGPTHGVGDAPAGARHGHRSARGRPHHARHGRARGKARRARSARRCAFRTRCISCCVRTAARRTTTFLHELGHALHFAYMRARSRVRVSLARRQLGHRRVRDAVRPPDAGRRVA